MRPRTVAEACARGTSREAFTKAIGEFLDTYYRTDDADERIMMLEAEPGLFKHEGYNALVGGMAEYLSKRWTRAAPPAWAGSRTRYLKDPWFPGIGDSPGLREYLTWCSPPEFKSRNVMTDARPFRRASVAVARLPPSRRTYP